NEIAQRILRTREPWFIFSAEHNPAMGIAIRCPFVLRFAMALFEESTRSLPRHPASRQRLDPIVLDSFRTRKPGRPPRRMEMGHHLVHHRSRTRHAGDPAHR